MTLPRLSGPRVALVPVPYAVAAAVVAGTGLAEALASSGLRAGPGWPHQDTTDALRPAVEQGDVEGESGWLVVLDDDGPTVIGDCGWLGGPDAAGVVEIGYGLAAPVRGRGLGTEAVAVLCAWAERQPGVVALAADVLVGNEPSRRLLSRLGFHEEPAPPPYARYLRPAPGQPAPRRRITGRHVC